MNQIGTEQIEFAIQSDELTHQFVLHLATHPFIIHSYTCRELPCLEKRIRRYEFRSSKFGEGTIQKDSRHRTAAKLLAQIAADMPLVPPPLIKPTIAVIAVIRAVVKGSQHMLFKNAIAPNSANPIAAAARAYQFRG
jgi:hypothetical protein